jgi:catechol 2,3-dioxygenase
MAQQSTKTAADNTGAGILHRDTRLGYVHLTVRDLAQALDYYQRAIGLNLHRQEGVTAYLGAGGRDLLALTQRPDAVTVRGHTGLYHFALLTPSRTALAHALQRLIDTGTQLTGGSDHGVSEALYLDDPEGNGIEIYCDRPRDEWPRSNGELRMTLDPLNYEAILAELDGQSAHPKMEPETVLGHMHLHVSQLHSAVDFYTGIIGLELQQYYGDSAAFLSAGGYHHHLGLNTWAGVGAPPPPENATGLREFVVELEDEDELDALSGRLDSAQVTYDRDGAHLLVRDPSQNAVRFHIRDAASS